MTEIQPRKVRTGDENINHSSIHSMKHVLEHQIVVAIKYAVKRGADAKKHDQSGAINQRDHDLIRRLRAEQQKKGRVAGW